MSEEAAIRRHSAAHEKFSEQTEEVQVYKKARSSGEMSEQEYKEKVEPMLRRLPELKEEMTNAGEALLSEWAGG